jgi:hypothetical protein
MPPTKIITGPRISPYAGGTGAPSGSGYTKIYSNWGAFAALKADGSIASWGYAEYGGIGAPSGKGYTKTSALRAAKAFLVE